MANEVLNNISLNITHQNKTNVVVTSQICDVVSVNFLLWGVNASARDN